MRPSSTRLSRGRRTAAAVSPKPSASAPAAIGPRSLITCRTRSRVRDSRTCGMTAGSSRVSEAINTTMMLRNWPPQGKGRHALPLSAPSAGPGSVEQAALAGHRHRLTTTGGAELGHDVADVHAGGLGAAEELGADL